MNNLLEVDLTEQIKAAVTTTCDNCGTKLGGSYPTGRNNIRISLPFKDNDGYDSWQDVHTCDEKCLRELLNKREKK